MRRSFDLSLRFACLALLFVSVNLSALSAQTRNAMDAQVDLSGQYAGELKFPSTKLNGKATLNVEGNKFTLRDSNGTERGGRISAVNNIDYVSIALMLDETPGENQPFAHSVMSLRMRKAGKNLILTSAPGETREFLFQAPLQSDTKLGNPVKVKLVNENCSNSASPNCGVNFGTVTADELEKAAQPAKAVKTKSKRQTNAAKAEKPIRAKATTQKNLSENPPKVKSPAKNNFAAAKSETDSRPAENKAQNETTKSQQTAAEQPTLNIQNSATQNQSSETNLSDLNKATEEMRRTMLELRRANDEIKATTDELRRLRTESATKTGETAAAKTESANAVSNEKAAVNSTTASGKKAVKSRKTNNSVKSAAKKPAAARSKSSKSVSSKTKTPSAKPEPAKASGDEKNAKPASSPEKPANQNANNSDGGKKPR
jgi:hypothetical protein